jgi:methylase of polypeptide subunit release factors|tara:strand:- start:2833 stop:3066 length:234 start_codon:yes stop_codon:yes gene_type:complete
LWAKTKVALLKAVYAFNLYKMALVMINHKYYGWDSDASDTHGYLYPTLYEMLAAYKDKRIVDVGCGNGVIACRLLDN